MIVYYENMNGEKLNLLKAPFRTTITYKLEGES